MSRLLRLVSKLPLPRGTKLSWQRSSLDRTYSKEIAAAKRSNNREKLRDLEHEYSFEMDLHSEEEDAYLTSKLLAKARRLKVPVPPRFHENQNETDYWYEGRHTGRWYLTRQGIAIIREEIRCELKAQHELRAQWAVWLSALTGVIGAITGLVALLMHKAT